MVLFLCEQVLFSSFVFEFATASSFGSVSSPYCNLHFFRTLFLVDGGSMTEAWTSSTSSCDALISYVSPSSDSFPEISNEFLFSFWLPCINFSIQFMAF